MGELLEALARGGVTARVFEEGGAAPPDGITLPLEKGRLLWLPRREDMERALAILAGICLERQEDSGRQGALLRLLRGESEPGGTALPDMEDNLERCVLVMRGKGDAAALLRTLQEIFPPDGPDLLLALPGEGIALIKQTRGMGQQEIGELCQAIEETVRAETGIRLALGAGESVKRLEQLSQSYHQAQEAMRVGTMYDPEGQIFLYGQLVLERLLQELPPGVRAGYHALLFNRRNSRLLSEEMLLTIEKLCECHLNLSETARRLYIHRNTLTYRLDKFQKATGLDPRRFKDAALYKILRMLGEGQRDQEER